jgi:MinD-like ATPase involved in chromosome partitioning or flagellar assembly
MIKRRRPHGGALKSVPLGDFHVIDSSRWRPPLGKRRPLRLIAVGAAGPGMGKSTVACNLAVAMAELGLEVVLVDFDLGAPSLHGLLGLARPRTGIQTWLDRGIDNVDMAVSATGVRKLQLVAGATAPPRLERALDLAWKRLLVQQLTELESDVVIVDVGAHNRDDLLDVFPGGALRLLVSSAARPALEATFAFLRGAALRAAACAGSGAGADLAWFAGRLVGNHTVGANETEALHAFARLVHAHLHIPLPVLGSLRHSDGIREARAARRPLLAQNGMDENVHAFHRMAEQLATEDASMGAAFDLSETAPLWLPAGPLPADLDTYLRRYPRHGVDWAATLELAGVRSDARVLDVSYTGAAVRVAAKLHPGERGILRFAQMPKQPALAVVVKNATSLLQRSGLKFVDPGETSARLVAAAVAAAAPAGAREQKIVPDRA